MNSVHNKQMWTKPVVCRTAITDWAFNSTGVDNDQSSCLHHVYLIHLKSLHRLSLRSVRVPLIRMWGPDVMTLILKLMTEGRMECWKGEWAYDWHTYQGFDACMLSGCETSHLFQSIYLSLSLFLPLWFSFSLCLSFCLSLSISLSPCLSLSLPHLSLSFSHLFVQTHCPLKCCPGIVYTVPVMYWIKLPSSYNRQQIDPRRIPYSVSRYPSSYTDAVSSFSCNASSL